MLETSIVSRGTSPLLAELLTPEIKTLEAGETYGKFAIEPLERGYGITIGNPMRRMLLSSIEGTAITWVKIDGILHEYSSIPHMKEEVIEFLLNVKAIRIRAITDRPGKMRLEITGEGRVCAGDIATSADFEIINPDLHLATLDSEDAKLSIEFNVDHGKGYQPVAQGDGLPGPLMGVLPVDAIFNPVRKVNYAVERTRVGHITDYERLILEMWTDGTITPVEALKKSSEVLVTHFFLFSNLGHEARVDRPSIMISPEIYQTPIEKLELSPRTLNCLKRAHLSKVGQVLEMSNSELLKIRNFGERSLQEILAKLSSQDMLSKEEFQARAGSNGADSETDAAEETIPATEIQDEAAQDQDRELAPEAQDETADLVAYDGEAGKVQTQDPEGDDLSARAGKKRSTRRPRYEKEEDDSSEFEDES